MGTSESGAFDGSSFDVSTNGDDVFPSVYHKDSFLLYRALCKLSMKSLQDDHGTMTDPIILQNKYDHSSHNSMDHFNFLV